MLIIEVTKAMIKGVYKGIARDRRAKSIETNSSEFTSNLKNLFTKN